MTNTLIIIAVLSGLLLFAGYRLNVVSSQKAVAEASVGSLVEALEQAREREENARAVLVARQAEIASTALKLSEAQKALSEALYANSQWSNTNVPHTVQNGLKWPYNNGLGWVGQPATPAPTPAQPSGPTIDDGGMPNDWFGTAGGGGN
jgi:hypothetical protein